MELNKIEELLEKYFEGNSNENEEKALRTYFLNEQVPEHLMQYKSLFGFFAEAKQTESKKEFMFKEKSNSKKNNWFSMSIAASVLVAIGTGIFMYTNYQPANHSDLGTYDDPKIALQETQKALALLSKHVNTGYDSVGYIEEFGITRDKIFNLDYK